MKKLILRALKKYLILNFLKLVSNIDGKINGNFNIDVDLNKKGLHNQNNSKSSINLSNLLFTNLILRI